MAQRATSAFPRSETVQVFGFFSKIPEKPGAVGWGERSEPQQSIGYVVPFVGVRTSPQPTPNSCTVSARGNAVSGAPAPSGGAWVVFIAVSKQTVIARRRDAGASQDAFPRGLWERGGFPRWTP